MNLASSVIEIVSLMELLFCRNELYSRPPTSIVSRFNAIIPKSTGIQRGKFASVILYFFQLKICTFHLNLGTMIVEVINFFFLGWFL